jgi:hypothetical protein
MSSPINGDSCRKPPTKLQPVFRFLDLPIELRFPVYQYLLTSSLIVQPPGDFPSRSTFLGYDITPSHLPRQRFDTSILLTSRQIYHEAIPYLYGGNKFRLQFPNHPDCHRWLKAIGISNCALIKSMELFWKRPKAYALWPPPFRFPQKFFHRFKAMQCVDVIVAVEQKCIDIRISQGDNEYLARVVGQIKSHLPQSCLVRWDVDGSNPELQKALQMAFGGGGYETVTTETRKELIEMLKRGKEQYGSTWLGWL